MSDFSLAEADLAPAPARRRLQGRQVEKVDRLLDAAVIELRHTGYEGLSVRGVAVRAGVAPATAYTYFASRDHLVAEVFRRRLAALPRPRPDRRRTPAGRVGAAIRALSAVLVDEPELAAASTTALLGRDPDVVPLRLEIGRELDDRIAEAVGEPPDPAVVRALSLVCSGALLQAGMGSFAYAAVADEVEAAAALILGPDRGSRPH